MLNGINSFLTRWRVWLAPAVCVPIFALTSWFSLSLHFASSSQIANCIWTALFLGLFSSGKYLFTRAAWWTWGYLALEGALLFVPMSWYIWALVGFVVVVIASRAIFTWRAGAELLRFRRQGRNA